MLALVAAPAFADDPPFVFPQTDVAVTYVAAGRPGVTQLLRVDAANGRQRVDAPGGGIAIITDTVRRTTILIDLGAGTFVVLPAPAGTSDMRGKRAITPYRRVGQDVVAGERCTVWDTRDASGRMVTVCLTADGILVRAASAAGVLVEAGSVTRATQPASLFVPAPGERQVRPPPGPTP